MLYARLNAGDAVVTGFAMQLYGAAQYERIDGVTSFVGEDSSGAFGIQARHGRMMTTLSYGLARFCLGEEDWRYLAFPGAVLYFADNTLHISARRYLCEADYRRIAGGLMEQLLAEEQELRGIKENLYRLEQEMLRRLWQMGRKP